MRTLKEDLIQNNGTLTASPSLITGNISEAVPAERLQMIVHE